MFPMKSKQHSDMHTYCCFVSTKEHALSASAKQSKQNQIGIASLPSERNGSERTSAHACIQVCVLPMVEENAFVAVGGTHYTNLAR